ncbi:UDP-glucose 4-epimerase GalE [Catelliglobosispora koreensis]|uniref:UDP-glucose 4-epimerase GalE n=1 Tax=Catelliglobosispora koreensis TaxID=129052 RepID=UPI00038164E0|nr:UDP-glucose 4-epimerase GalE [Catelliglobosispora koreensis]
MTEKDVWLVTGGAGYIGGHTVARLHAQGHAVVVLDDLSSGLAHRVPDGVPFVNAAVQDLAAVAEALREHKVTGVIHFAAKKSVPESMADPILYYRENLGGMTSLLGAMVETGVKKIVISSTAAVYGMVQDPIVTEDTPTAPINPYGHTKLICEQMVRAAGEAHGISWLALRYFNAVGADDPALADRGISNLFPLIFRAFAAGKPALVTGDDFDTHDGTGVRDYIHVADLADAHVAAVERLNKGAAADFYNVGTGQGYSVLDVLAALREVTGEEVPYTVGPRRPGDPASVVASVERIRTDLGWSAQRDLMDMVSSAWSARKALELSA